MTDKRTRHLNDDGTDTSIDTADLTLTDIDFLAALASGAGSGQELKAQIETERDRDIPDATLYQSLGRLGDAGLVDKRARDRRTNEYRLTPDGVDVVHDRLQWVAQQCGLRVVDADHRLASAEPATSEVGD